MGNLIQRRGIWIAAAGAVAVVGVAALTGRPSTPPPTVRSASPAAPSAAAVTGPIVFYEILDADASVLVERRLDGVSAPRPVARRLDADEGRTWTVDPAGTIAISGVTKGPATHLVAVAVADGTELWNADVPVVQLDGAVWSSDGRRLATIARPDDAGPSEAQLIDVRDGRLTRAVVPDGAVLQGFDRANALILRERADAAGGTIWRFLRVDPATNVVGAVREVPTVGPATSGSDDVDPAHGVAVTVGLAANQQDAALMAASLTGGPARSIATFASVDRLAIDPTGAGVAVAANDTIRFVTWDGRATDLWHGPDSASDFAWSADGSDLIVATGEGGGSISVVELATGRIVDLPRQVDVAQMLLVRVVGGGPLPAAALPAAEPTPTPTAAPSGGDLAGAPTIASAWLDAGTGSLMLHAERLLPTSGGGMRVAASMTSVDLGPAAPNADDFVRVLPRPRSDDVLLWVDTGNRAEGWLWDGRTAPRRLALPRDWPAQAFDVAWRPDGAALGGGADVGGATGDELAPVFVVAAPGAAHTTVIHAPHDYDRFNGWWSTSSIRIGHVICTEGCPGRYALSARLRLSDGRVTPFSVADRPHGAIDEVFGDGHGGLLMTPLNTITADAIRIDWPLGGSADGPQFVGWAADGRSLVLASEAPGGLDVYRVDDPAGRAVHGRVTDPAPTLLGHLAHRVLGIVVSPDAHWATTTDRTGAAEIVELATGRTWPLGRDRVLEWWPVR